MLDGLSMARDLGMTDYVCLEEWHSKWGALYHRLAMVTCCALHFSLEFKPYPGNEEEDDMRPCKGYITV